jgi:hypothetical protein
MCVILTGMKEKINKEFFRILHSVETELSQQKLIQLYVESSEGSKNPFLIKEYKSNSKVRKNEMVIYTPGGGGDGTLNFELNYLDYLLHQGYDTITIRHCGLNQFKEEGRRLLNLSGEEIGSSIADNNGPGNLNYIDWSREPEAVLEYLDDNYTHESVVKLIGHSFAGMSNRVSMVNYRQNNPDSTLQISNVVELSPANYSDGLMVESDCYNGWKGFFDSQTSLPKAYNGVNSPEELLSQVVEVARLDKEARLLLRELFPNTNFAVVIPSGDTYVDQNVGEVLQSDIPEGVVVVKQEFADKIEMMRGTLSAESTMERDNRFKAKGGAGEIHDNNQLTPKDLVRLLEITAKQPKNVIGGKRIQKLITNATRIDHL